MKNLSDSLINCTRCQQSLLVEGILSDQACMCPECGSEFVGLQAQQNKNDRRAIISFLLGLGSFVLFVILSIPAIWMGLSSLKMIRLGQASKKGSKFAQMGVVLGSLSAILGILTVVSVVVLVGVIFNRFEVTLDQQAALAETQKFFQYPEFEDTSDSTFVSLLGLAVVAVVKREETIEITQPENDLELTQSFELQMIANRKGNLFGSAMILAMQEQMKDLAKQSLVNETFELENSFGNFHVEFGERAERDHHVQRFIAVVPQKQSQVLVAVTQEISETPGYEADQLYSVEEILEIMRAVELKDNSKK